MSRVMRAASRVGSSDWGGGPDGAEPGLDLGVAQVLQPDAEALAVREVGVGPAAAREVGIDLEHTADVALAGPGLLGLEDEAAALVEVDPQGGGRTLGLASFHAALEDLVV